MWIYIATNIGRVSDLQGLKVQSPKSLAKKLPIICYEIFINYFFHCWNELKISSFHYNIQWLSLDTIYELIGNHVHHCILEGWFYFLEFDKFEIDLLINLLGDVYSLDEIEKPLCLLS
jgi:hypothetical protein